MIKFTIAKKDRTTRARCATLRTRHFDVQTPNFMPVATQATVKTQSPADLKKIGVQIIICNTYHLMLRPTSQVISDLGGLHRFMNWDRAIVTDSGGFQAYSLTDLRKVSDDGIEFSSHLDGSRHFLTPESAVIIQEELKPDIAMCLDVLSAYPAEFLQARITVERTVKWAERSLAVKKKYHYSQ
ncbi:MAG: tRNA-guanine transglycosylase [candidate division WOR-3 bacterium]|nr:MAG: tRNA-guanine transglycosylase [candidate division WOR-3 bacterium]